MQCTDYEGPRAGELIPAYTLVLPARVRLPEVTRWRARLRIFRNPRPDLVCVARWISSPGTDDFAIQTNTCGAALGAGITSGRSTSTKFQTMVRAEVKS